MTFSLTPKQERATEILASDATHSMLWGGARCVSGDTVLDGHVKPISVLAQEGLPVVVRTTHGWQMAEAPFRKGRCSMLEFRLASGRSVTVTPDHRFWDGCRWKKAEEFSSKDEIAVLPSGSSARFWRHAPSTDIPSLSGYQVDRVSVITRTAEQDYYTLHVPGTEQYFANGVLHHNSGKTVTIVRAICVRAMAMAETNHAILRFRFNHVKSSIVYGTLPEVMRLQWPHVPYKIDKVDWFATFPNGSRIWFGGLDEKERAEKILGNQFSTVYLNECSQIPWGSRNIAITRLAEKRGLRPRAWYDANPPSAAHWTYKVFIEKRDPITNQPLANPENYASYQINPRDNAENLTDEFLAELQALPARERLRFWEGQFGDATEGALWSIELLDQQRTDEQPPMQRIIIAVDPSGASGKEDTRSDEIGIIVVGLGTDAKVYVLEDLSIKAGPAEWSQIVTGAFDRWKADRVVAEKNFGGAMVEHVIKAGRPDIPYREVNASRGKHVRAEPIAALFEQQKVWLAGRFPDLESQMLGMTTAGYVGPKSPDRLDAMVWGISELFPAATRTSSPMTRAPVVNMGPRHRQDRPRVNTGRR